MIHALLFTFSGNPQNCAFHVQFTEEDDGKEASWLHSFEIIICCNYSVL